MTSTINVRPIRSIAIATIMSLVTCLSAYGRGRCPDDLIGEHSNYPDYNAPVIKWRMWPFFFGETWRRPSTAPNDWFPFDDVSKAAKAIAFGKAESPFYNPNTLVFYENYKSPSAASAEEVANYESAAELYRDKKWDNAILMFDKIVLTKSPYRAAAAYSAARASLYRGTLDDGFGRIRKIISDPTLDEFHQAAFHLVGTLAYQTGAPPLVAAQLAQTTHYLTAPLDILCQSSTSRQMYTEAYNNIEYILDSVFHEYAVDFSGSRQRTRDVLDAASSINPVFDLIRVVSAPFRRQISSIPDEFNKIEWEENFLPNSIMFESDGIEGAFRFSQMNQDDLTDHARTQWFSTKNLLWGYALALRTSDVKDIDFIDVMIRKVSDIHLSSEIEIDGATVILHNRLFQQKIRLLLISNRYDDALNLLKTDTFWRDESKCVLNSCLGNADPYSILNDGIRFFVEEKNMERARLWNIGVLSILGAKSRVHIDYGLSFLLASNWSEFVELDKDNDLTTARSALDLLPARRLVALSDQPDISAEVQRALLSAGWVRFYMLDRQQEFLDLIPKMRRVFPELAPDLDMISSAWTERARRRMITKLLLRTPGLSPRVTWSRAAQQSLLGIRDMNVLSSIEGGAPSDVNWWCPLDIERLMIDVLGGFFVSPTEPGKRNLFDPAALTGVSQDISQYLDSLDYVEGFDEPPDHRLVREQHRELVKAARELIAWHPLFKDVDWAELEQLSKVENGPRRLSEEAVQWAAQSNWVTRALGLDHDLPETLHLAVRSTRYGCRLAGGHGAYSRAAYQALHRLYPDSDWAKATPYWFDRPGRDDTAINQKPH